jgi:lipopolysaccharide/colanic/teichoic acid biosynthesis glycosyltransferase
LNDSVIHTDKFFSPPDLAPAHLERCGCSEGFRHLDFAGNEPTMTTMTAATGLAQDTGTYRGRLMAKRAFDLFVVAVSLVVLSPLFFAVAAALLVSEGRPILFRQRRVGRYGEPFTMWKFRTMVIDAEDQLEGLKDTNERSGPLFKMTVDPRVTRIGRFLRATSLDELPQLANVMGGTMSLVGPRPALYEERASFTPDLLAREIMPPGITGLWQVEARTDGDFDRYRQFDLQYVDKWTLRLDILLLIKTPFVMARHALQPGITSELRPTPVPEAT